jgi:hypothetical protein
MAVNYRGKKFYNIGPWAQGYKTFFVHKLRIFVISLIVCHWQAFQSGLTDTLAYYVNHGQKSFITLAPGACLTKHLTAVINCVT